ncbi:MAG: hypothetical protein IJ672_05890 [Methanobrevibacter sp.]|nr:hypothetical protein [Methanobrevibacter sp.]
MIILNYGSLDSEAFFEEEYIRGIDKKAWDYAEKKYALIILYATEHSRIEKYEFRCNEEQASAFISQWLKYKGYLKK